MKKVMLDPGHGGKDSGAVGNSLKEKEIVLAISQYAKRFLETQYQGVEVRLTRADDRFIPLNERAQLANNWGADVFVSIHINAGGGSGFETFRSKSANDLTVTLQNTLHNEILKSMNTVSPIKDRGRQQANFLVLRQTAMPAVLTENLFIDSGDSRQLKDQAFLKATGEAHAKAIAAFLKLKAVPSKGGTDVSPQKGYSAELTKAVEWAKKQGISDGQRVNEPATRGEILIMLYRALANK
ncbi:N-acetylmuramoyl-L-alanine amidase family protein [Priestia koreensis]|uniref:N-acetylmuramoyl-L-alanine amidase family protein n=1 Tax=Priestia koreensis TaxID=284581 RepID=UPI002041D8E7|nr:N-acetylmuramoyl-L-alanine amidase [Priestia koreensis]MCM3005288.1 N-acetylmuramoyl-L-alanine amidase [Priestia koreensis]